MSPQSSDRPDAHLYGQPRPKRKPIASSTSHSFASSLNSLLASAPTKASGATSARQRPSKNRKDDIFSVHNKGAKKRAAADLEGRDSTEQKHQKDIGVVDHDTLHRSKRKMEEKARLYAAMKRGDYVAPNRGINDEESGPLVDFDRKWAEDEADGKEVKYDTTSDDGGDSEEEELVEYTDEFGRTRKGTRAEVARDSRKRRVAANAEQELEEMSARPSMPTGVIYGDTVQSSAFDPDDRAAEVMAHLAAKRDRSATPPEEVHYDATKEIRSKGVGFFQFSKDKESREREMQELEKERQETVKHEQEREERRQKKAKELEERKRKIKEKRGEREADDFLKTLGSEIGS